MRQFYAAERRPDGRLRLYSFLTSEARGYWRASCPDRRQPLPQRHPDLRAALRFEERTNIQIIERSGQ
jgi:hypothetical protein